MKDRSMAVLVSKAMGELNKEQKALFLLFQKPCKSRLSDSENEVPPNLSAPANTAIKMAPKRGRASQGSNPPNAPDQKPTESSEEHAESIEVDPNQNRKKRQKTNSSGVTDLVEDSDRDTQVASAVRLDGVEGRKVRSNVSSRDGPRGSAKSPQVIGNTLDDENGNLSAVTPSLWAQENLSQEIQQEAAQGQANGSEQALATEEVVSKPKKILHFNPKTGTIGSPPSKKAATQQHNADTEKAPTVKRPAGRPRKPKSKIVIIHYGQSQQEGSIIGVKINQILNNTKKMPDAENMPLKGAVKPKPEKTFEGTPWWLLKKNKTNSASEKGMKNTQKEPMTSSKPTLTSPTKSTSLLDFGQPRLRGEAKVFTRPTKSALPAFGSSTKMLKFHGAAEPAWPWQGMIHIRGNDTKQGEDTLSVESPLAHRSKKAKYQAVEVQRAEDIIGQLARKLDIDNVVKEIGDINLDEFTELPPCLRVPTKHFESGRKLQQRVRKELISPLSSARNVEDSSEEELSGMGTRKPPVHPVLSKMFSSIVTSLSAFDKFEWETQSWIQKYSPKCADDVLQSGREVLILKAWLLTLKVISVETGSLAESRAKAELPSRRKRKAKKLDGFVVSSDEDEDNDDMDEITEPEDEPSPGGRQRLSKRSVIRSKDAIARGSKDSGRLTNAVVMSGPSGCGKTAAIYAVAKELNFEIFEINPSTRRSGRDVLERVGDMTRNHLVQRSNDAAAPEDDDSLRLSKALADDLKSGRQGTMNSFFRPKPKEAPKGKGKAKSSTTTAKNEKTALPKAPTKQQKQSLILLEEADILYEQDKQFWATIMSLITQSKRPVIMTCNDESALPLSSLSLHAIIRFSPPPTDLGVDYMLLIAGNEGHVLRRESVQTLYESRNLDLRASITELNFWCQFAVGDRKGGLEWLEPRWPVNCDLDENGETKRVISQGTYETGMGFLSRDFMTSDMNCLKIEEETLREAWDEWELDVGDWQFCPDMGKWAGEMQSEPSKRNALFIYEVFVQSMSVVDICSYSAYASGNQTLLDTTPLPLSSKARTDYTIAAPLLSASPLPSLSPQSSTLSLTIHLKSLALSTLQNSSPIVLLTPTEQKIITLIRSPPSFTPLVRSDFTSAFEPLSTSSTTFPTNTASSEISIFDRSTSTIAKEVAPFVRAIVRYDEKLMMERRKLGGLLSEGGLGAIGGSGSGGHGMRKRMRTTRSAMSALAGGERRKTRRERYFDRVGKGFSARDVVDTGGEAWGRVVDDVVEVHQEQQKKKSEERMNVAIEE